MKPSIEQLELRLALAGVPVLSSFPGASATIYLDFDGDVQAQWANFSNVSTPAFSLDQRPTDFNAAEAAFITKVFRYVAEDYSPFNVNVTTAEPPSFDHAVRVAIGGDGSWAGPAGASGGLSFVGSYTNELPNVCFVFSGNLVQDPSNVADASSHEAGHCFGLLHQVDWTGGVFVSQYREGPGDGTAPLMGFPYDARRSLWWYGATLSPTTYQDEFAVLTGVLGLRPDEPTRVLTDKLTGVISTEGDRDAFTFATTGGSFVVRVSSVGPFNNLDSRLEVRNAAGNVVASNNPTGSFSAAVSVKLAAGTYTVIVAGAGPSKLSTPTNFGFDVGQYTLSVQRQP